MKILLCHPGHSHSTVDVFLGLCAGLEMQGVTVVRFEWGRILQTMQSLAIGAVMGGIVDPDKAEKAQLFMTQIASGDAVTIALDEDVDAVIVVNGLLFPRQRALVLQKLGVPVACFGTEAPYFLEVEQAIAPFYTHWFTNERKCVKDFADLTSAHYLPHAYNPAVHTPRPAEPERARDVVFVGGGYPERKTVIDGARAHGVAIETLGTLWHLDLEQEQGVSDMGRRWRYTEGAIPNDEALSWYASAKIGLNLHRRMTWVEKRETVPAGAAASLGPRAYEIPAVGGFMLCDDERPELREVYGEAAATFRAWDADDLAYQARYWLAHDDARERMRRAQHEAVAPHHWGNRAKTVLETLFA